MDALARRLPSLCFSRLWPSLFFSLQAAARWIGKKIQAFRHGPHFFFLLKFLWPGACATYLNEAQKVKRSVRARWNLLGTCEPRSVRFAEAAEPTEQSPQRPPTAGSNVKLRDWTISFQGFPTPRKPMGGSKLQPHRENSTNGKEQSCEAQRIRR
jgi:hypothetical protein